MVVQQRQTISEILAKEEFVERCGFFQETLDLDIGQFFQETTTGVVFQKLDFFKSVLGRTLHKYRRGNAELFAAEFDVDAYVESFGDADIQQVPNLVFNRVQLYEIKKARGEDIQKWLQENLQNFSNQIIKISLSASREDLAKAVVSNELLAMNAGFGNGMAGYSMVAPLAPVPLEGATVLAELIQSVVAVMAANPMATVIVVTIAVVIAVILVSIAAIDRELTCLIVNDTDHDVAIEDIHMEHGSMTAIISDSSINVANTIPKKKSENMVYGSFYTIEKNFGFYGAECTLRLKFINPDKAIYYLAANPLSQESRLGLQLNNSSSSAAMHCVLYEHGSTSVESQYGNLHLAANLNNAHGKKAYAINYISQILNEFVSFESLGIKHSEFLEVKETKNVAFLSSRGCYNVGKGGEINCSLTAVDRGHKVIFVLASDPLKDYARVQVDYGRQILATIDVDKGSFDEFIFVVPEYLQLSKAPRREIKIKHIGGTADLFIKRLEVQKYSEPPVLADWMSGLPDSIPLADINIPGTHDAAAINKSTHTLYACHHSTITEQLNGGIRCMDVRIKVKEQGGKFVFMTCHGAIAGSTTLNEFQSLVSLLDECKAFLNAHRKETVIMSLKVDDWEITEGKQPKALEELKQLLKNYPIKNNYRKLGNLADVRGKIVLLNRINEDVYFGAPMFWTPNTDKEYTRDNLSLQPLKHRDFDILVQDKFQFGTESYPEKKKYDLVTGMFGAKRANDGKVVLNYASACKYAVIGVYIHKMLLTYFGQEKRLRPVNFGWTMLDYAFDSYKTDVYGAVDIVSLIVASNFNYAGCDHNFKLED